MLDRLYSKELVADNCLSERAMLNFDYSYYYKSEQQIDLFKKLEALSKQLEQLSVDNKDSVKQKSISDELVSIFQQLDKLRNGLQKHTNQNKVIELFNYRTFLILLICKYRYSISNFDTAIAAMSESEKLVKQRLKVDSLVKQTPNDLYTTLAVSFKYPGEDQYKIYCLEETLDPNEKTVEMASKYIQVAKLYKKNYELAEKFYLHAIGIVNGILDKVNLAYKQTDLYTKLTNWFKDLYLMFSGNNGNKFTDYYAQYKNFEVLKLLTEVESEKSELKQLEEKIAEKKFSENEYERYLQLLLGLAQNYAEDMLNQPAKSIEYYKQYALALNEAPELIAEIAIQNSKNPSCNKSTSKDDYNPKRLEYYVKVHKTYVLLNARYPDKWLQQKVQDSSNKVQAEISNHAVEISGQIQEAIESLSPYEKKKIDEKDLHNISYYSLKSSNNVVGIFNSINKIFNKCKHELVKVKGKYDNILSHVNKVAYIHGKFNCQQTAFSMQHRSLTNEFESLKYSYQTFGLLMQSLTNIYYYTHKKEALGKKDSAISEYRRQLLAGLRKFSDSELMSFYYALSSYEISMPMKMIYYVSEQSEKKLDFRACGISFFYETVQYSNNIGRLQNLTQIYSEAVDALKFVMQQRNMHQAGIGLKYDDNMQQLIEDYKPQLRNEIKKIIIGKYRILDNSFTNFCDKFNKLKQSFNGYFFYPEQYLQAVNDIYSSLSGSNDEKLTLLRSRLQEVYRMTDSSNNWHNQLNVRFKEKLIALLKANKFEPKLVMPARLLYEEFCYKRGEIVMYVAENDNYDELTIVEQNKLFLQSQFSIKEDDFKDTKDDVILFNVDL